MKPITLVSDGQRIAGNLYTAQEPTNLAFLFLHGWLGHQNLVAAQALAKLGCTSLTYSMRGNEDSEGDITTLTRADFLTDATIAYDFLRKQVGNDCNIGIVGSSFGCYIGLLLSETRGVRCISMRVPANYPDDMFHKPEPVDLSTRKAFYDEWRQQPREAHQNRALQALHKFNGLVQIIEAGNDEQVPHQTVQNFVNAITNASKLSYTIMKDAPHSMPSEALQEEYGRLLAGWVHAQIPHVS